MNKIIAIIFIYILCFSVFIPENSLANNAKKPQKKCTDCHKDSYKKLSGENNHKPFKEKDCYAC